MDDQNSHGWWAVDCTTPDCGTKLLLDCTGPLPPERERLYRVHMIPRCFPFKETCPECNVEHKYSVIDLHHVQFEAPAEGYVPSASFRKAIQQAQQSDQPRKDQPDNPKPS